MTHPIYRQVNNLDWLRDKIIYVEAKIDEAIASIKTDREFIKTIATEASKIITQSK